MGSPRAFLDVPRAKSPSRPAGERLKDWNEFEVLPETPAVAQQASRCMDCGVPYCHTGCPLGNVIPEWNDLVFHQKFDDALAALHETNNFPEVTGRVCPAPCETSCVLNLENAPVTIKNIERTIIDRSIASKGLPAQKPLRATGKLVAVIGSGPAGLAAAQQLARKGHSVTVFEKSDRPGGLLRYGIPDFKLEKSVIDRRLEQLREEGVEFRCNTECGKDISGSELQQLFDAIVLCGGAPKPRDLSVPGREFDGVHYAMDFLTLQNKRVAGDEGVDALSATGKHVIVLGGGDTGSDCVGTSLRQAAASVTSLELLPRAPDTRAANDLWPAWPHVFRTSSSHEEGGTRDFAAMTTRLLGVAGKVTALEAVRVELKNGKPTPVPGSEFQLRADLVLLAMGFVGPGPQALLEQLGVERDGRGNVKAVGGRTSVDGVFAAGDISRGQSLVVWAIAEGRQVAKAVDAHLALAPSARGGRATD